MAYAGVGRRSVAAIIDLVVLFAIAYVMAMFTGGITDEGFEVSGGPFFLTMLIWLAYYIGMEGAVGASVGKLLVGLRVLRVDGSRLDWPAAVVRNVLRLVDGLFFYLVGALLAWGSPSRQRLGDRVAGTIVVRQRGAAAEVVP